MLKNLGKLKYSTKEKEFKISLNELKSGINFFESFIVYQDNSGIKIYDRKCGHAGGKITNNLSDDKMQKAKYGPSRWLKFSLHGGSAKVDVSTVSGRIKLDKK